MEKIPYSTNEFRKNTDMLVFKSKRESWIEELLKEDRNSIIQQIWLMFWDTAIYNVILEARRQADKASCGRVKLNGMVHNLIDRYFFQSQALAVRRLVEKRKNERNYSRAVYSLKGLLEDIKANIHLFTRENIFAAEDRPYDTTHIRKAYREYCEQKERAGNSTYAIPRELDFECHEKRHEEIDILAEVDKANRSPKDTIKQKIIMRLEDKIVHCEEIVVYVNKFIAHAATTESRKKGVKQPEKSINADDITLTLGELVKAQEVFYKVSNFVSSYILVAGGIGWAAEPRFEYIDRPLIAVSYTHLTLPTN